MYVCIYIYIYTYIYIYIYIFIHTQLCRGAAENAPTRRALAGKKGAADAICKPERPDGRLSEP